MTEKSHRVVIISQEFPPERSGNASRIHDTARHLRGQGWDVTVLSPPPTFPHGQFDRSLKRKEVHEIDDITVYRLWTWQPVTEDPRFFSRIAYYLFFPLHAFLWLLVNYRRYDLVISSTPPIFTGIAALPFGLLGFKPWVLDVRDLWIDASVGLGFIRAGGVLEWMSRRYQRFALHVADRVTVTTSVLGEKLAQTYGVDNRKIVHVPNGVDTSEYRPGESPSEPIIVYTGNVGYAQDLESCIRAMSEVIHPEAELKIVGDGDLRGELEDMVEAQGLQDRVTFTGLVPREEVPEILDDAMIGIAPLKSDDTLEYAIPTKIYEYMACELPVVATGIGEIETLIEETRAGVVVDNEPESIAQQFDTLLADGATRAMMGKHGRRHMVDHYDRAAVAKQLDTVLRDLLHAGRDIENQVMNIDRNDV